MNNIEELRLKTGLSIQQFSDLLNVYRDTFGKWKRGERKPDNATIRLLEIIELAYSDSPDFYQKLIKKYVNMA